jgi:hypothetical protein
MTGYEKDTANAIAALEHRLANREPGTDDRAFAAEFVQAMIGQGWRPTNAKPAPVVPNKVGGGAEPPPEYFDALAEVRAKAERDRRARLSLDAPETPGAA